MKKAGIVLTLGLAAAIGSAVPFSAMAADETKDVTISTNQTSQSAQSTVELNKTEEAVPVYTVSVPATIELGRDAVKVPITLSLQDDTSLVPMDKKVSVKIASAKLRRQPHQVCRMEQQKAQRSQLSADRYTACCITACIRDR